MNLAVLVSTCLILAFAACASSPPPPVDEVSAMSLDEKVGQLFMVGAEGTFMNASSAPYRRLSQYVRDHHVAGVIWFGADVYETAWVNDRLQSEAKIPLLISADLESGLGMRFENTTFWPWPMAIAATGDPSNAELEGRIVAGEAKLIGINQIYAPVADVNNNPDNPVINVRSYGEDPDAVARFVAAFVRGVQAEGVLATAKHFPGHGDTHTDSHRSLPVLQATRGRLDQIELRPFRAAIEEDVAAVMLAHLSIPELDPTPIRRARTGGSNIYAGSETEVTRNATVPASLSPLVVEGLLRRELGFDGLVVTDALDMGGITDHFDPGEAAIRAIEAGADQVLKSADTVRSIEAVKGAVLSGRISIERLDRSVRRILKAKRQVHTIPFAAEEIFRAVDHPEHNDTALSVAQQAVTLVRDAPGHLPLDAASKTVELVVGDFPDDPALMSVFHRELTRRLASPPPRFVVDRRSRTEDLEPVLEAIGEAEAIVIALTVRTRSGEGAVAIPAPARELIEQIQAHPGKRIVAISFGSPYLLREVPVLETYLAVYGIQPVMQLAAVRAIFGEAPIQGRLPVTIPGLAPRGVGITR